MPIYIRKPNLCCECDYWKPYIDQYGVNWGYCKKGKSAFPDMPKCEEFNRELGGQYKYERKRGTILVRTRKIKKRRRVNERNRKTRRI